MRSAFSFYKIHENYAKIDQRPYCKSTKVLEILAAGGTKFNTDAMHKILWREKIELISSNLGTPQRNGVTKRLNREIEEKIRVNFLSTKMPYSFWKCALKYVLYIHNCYRTNRLTLIYELLTGLKVSINYIKRFGCKAFILDQKEKQKPKFAPTAQRGFVLDCSDSGYVVINDVKNTIVRCNKGL